MEPVILVLTQTEIAGLWIGIVAGIAGTILAAVAIWFAVWVNNRATEVNDQTIRSLQKIESTVESMSNDTKQLIKVAWDKMLGDVGASTKSTEAVASDSELASGLSAEIRSELAPTQPGGASAPMDPRRIEKLIKDIERTVAAQVATSKERPSEAFERFVSMFERISPEAREMTRILLDLGHIEAPILKRLTDTTLAAAIDALRDGGLLVPLKGRNAAGEQIPVYWLPPRTSGIVNAALQVSLDSPNVRQQVMEVMAAAGYKPEPHKDTLR